MLVLIGVSFPVQCFGCRTFTRDFALAQNNSWLE